MAGYAYGFDEGGPVDDNSGAIPVAEADEAPAAQEEQPAQRPIYSDDSGMAPFRAAGSVIDQSQHAMQDLEQPSQSGARAPHQALRDTGKAILSYLMGADAAQPEANKKFVAGVQAEHPDLTPDDANVVAVHKAYEWGGPEAAWQLVQFNRMAYDAKQNFAFAALNGTQGKPPDVQAAANAATQASQHVLDGSSAQFQATPDGFVTATVRGPTGQQTSFQMSPTDFARYLNVGADGQYDKVLESGGVAGTLQKVASAGKAAKGSSGMADTYEDDDTDTGDLTPIHRKGTANGSNFGKTPSTLDLSDGKDETYQPKDDLQSRANQRFPSASQGEQRAAWLADQQTQAAQARRGIRKAEAEGVVKRDVAAITGGSRVDAAGKRADATVDAAGKRAGATVAAADKRLEGVHETNQTRTAIADKGIQQRAADLQQRIKQMEVTHGDRVNRQRLDAASRRMNNVNAAIAKGGIEDVQAATAEMQALEKELSAPQQAAPQGAPQGNGNPPAAGSPSQPPEKGAKFYKGKWYRRAPDGSAQPIQ